VRQGDVSFSGLFLDLLHVRQGCPLALGGLTTEIHLYGQDMLTSNGYVQFLDASLPRLVSLIKAFFL
jgi:hypothetical protein